MGLRLQVGESRDESIHTAPRVSEQSTQLPVPFDAGVGSAEGKRFRFGERGGPSFVARDVEKFPTRPPDSNSRREALRLGTGSLSGEPSPRGEAQRGLEADAKRDVLDVG